LPRLREARVPGRTQLLTATGRLPLVLDGAHNPGGMEALAAWLRKAFPGARVLALFSLMRDKDAASVVRALRSFAAEIAFVPLERYPRALGFAELGTALASAGVAAAGIREFPLETAALDDLLRPSPGKPDLVVACGSLYLLGELIPRLVPWYPDLEPFRQFLGES
jgi:dihydrofolate synthase/folylpolyglutamate synthase